MDNVAIPEHIERAISTPHEHEGPDNPPCWLLMENYHQSGWHVACVDLSEKACRYHYRLRAAVVDTRLFVERVPTGHLFASEMLDTLWKENRDIMKRWRRMSRNRALTRYRHEGD